jgi:hypothetical protein
MNRRHALVISIFLALALVAGAFAALRTNQLGARATTVPAAQIAAKNRQLDRYESALRRQARKRPPAVPALPTASHPAVAAMPPRVIYRRPPAIVRVVHRHHEQEREQFDD